MAISPRRSTCPRAVAGAVAAAVVAALLVPVGGGTAAASGSAPDATGPAGITSPAGITGAVARVPTPRPAAGEAVVTRTSRGRLVPAHGPVTVVLELDQRTVVAAYRGAGGTGTAAARASQEQTSRVQGQQRAVAEAFARPETAARELYAVHNVYNGVYATTDASRLGALASLPGVKAVHLATPKTRSNATVVPLTGSPRVWSGTNAGTGKGVRIGIIDTGIDYLHANFGGPGTAAAYAAQSPTDATDTPQFFGPNAVKVKGGYDFVGDAYDATPSDATYNPVPHPDADPLDCASNLGGGHGSHVAGSAAGFGVVDGQTYGVTGAGASRAFDPSKYSASTDFGRFSGLGASGQPGIGPGTAPGADLYALRVFGCHGSTMFVTAAIDYAADPNQDGNLADHLDVVNLSLGSSGAPEDDVDDVATDNLSALGTTVVVAAGNSGDNHYEVGSPGAALSALTVAASDDSTAVTDAVRTTIGAASPVNLAAENSIDFNFKGAGGDFTGSVARISGPAADGSENSDGCKPFSDVQKAAVAGKLAALEWDDTGSRRCGSKGRTDNAAAAGALGAVLLSNSPTFAAGIAGDTLVPTSLVATPGADRIRAALTAAPAVPVTATIGYGLRNAGRIVLAGAADPTDSIASFTSRGGGYGATAKPDVSAPGVSIFSTSSGTGTEGQNDSGTSMASPHTAGIAALVKAAHPTYTPAQVKAAVMGTASNDLFRSPGRTGSTYGASRVGAGRVQANLAVQTSVLAYDTARPAGVTVSFGTIAATADQTLTRSVTVQNNGPAAQSYQLAYTARVAVAGAAVTVPASVTVPAASSATFPVTLTLTRSALRRSLDPTEAPTQVGLPRQFLAELSGLVTLSQSGAEKLRVPVYAAPRPASTVRAASPRLTIAAPPAGSTTSTTPLPLTGSPVANPGTSATSADGVTSVTSGYELAATSPALPPCGGGSTGGCLRQPSQGASDLKAIGVSSTFVPATATAPADRLISFAINVQRPWKTPAGFSSFQVLIDANGDGTPDHYVVNTRVPAGNDDTDVLIAATYAIGAAPDGSQDTLVDTEFLNGVDGATDTAIFNSDVVILPVLASQLGLTGDGRFTYRVSSADRYNDFSAGALDTVGPLSFAGLRPGLSVEGPSGTRLFPEASTPSLPVRTDTSTLRGDAAQGLLLVHHHDADGARAETVTLTNGTTTTLTTDAPPRAPVGQPLTLHAQVSKSDPTNQAGLGAGSVLVTFRDGGTVLGTTPLTGQGTADYVVGAPTAGPHSYAASYPGNGSAYLPSDSAPVVVTVAQVPTSTTLTTSGSPSAAGAPLTLTARVEQSGAPTTAGPVTGTVTFRDGADVLGTAPVLLAPEGGSPPTATLTTTGLGLGDHTLSAAYAGTATFLPSTSGARTQTVVINASTTTLVPGAGPYRSGSGLPVAVTVTSPGGPPTGTVTVTVDGLAPRSAALTGGAAALSLTGIAPGRHTLRATYAGDGSTATSASAPVGVDVLPTVSVAASASTVTVTGPRVVKAGRRGAKFSVTVRAAGGAVPTAGRPVALYVDGVRRANLVTGKGGTIGYYVSFRKGRHKVDAVCFGAPDLLRGVSGKLAVRAI